MRNKEPIVRIHRGENAGGVAERFFCIKTYRADGEKYFGNVPRDFLINNCLHDYLYYNAVMAKESVCLSKCAAYCCKSTIIVLQNQELPAFASGQHIIFLDIHEFDAFLPKNPSDTTIYVKDEPDDFNHPTTTIYMTLCPYLEQSSDECTIYTNPIRPLACRMMPPGHPYCTQKRSDNHVPPIER